MADAFDAKLGAAPGGEPIGVVRLESPRLRVALSNYGARMLSIEAPDRRGTMDHVLLGCPRPDMILKAGSFGAVLGRTANRIAHARFTLDGTTFELTRNDGDNTLHGGKSAFSRRFWSLAERMEQGVTFALTSPDGDGGYPGELAARATYTLDGDVLRLELTATTTKSCPVNLSAHPYFNLAGTTALDCCDHRLTVHAAAFLPTDAGQIPTGEQRTVEGSIFDFRKATEIGTRIRSADEQLLYARGFDHCFVIDGKPGTLRPAARLEHAPTGRVMEISSDREGLQVYTSNSLDGSLVGHGGTYRMTAGLALEAEGFPDAPNQPSFPSITLRPGEHYRSTIEYRFTTL